MKNPVEPSGSTHRFASRGSVAFGYSSTLLTKSPSSSRAGRVSPYRSSQPSGMPSPSLSVMAGCRVPDTQRAGREPRPLVARPVGDGRVDVVGPGLQAADVPHVAAEAGGQTDGERHASGRVRVRVVVSVRVTDASLPPVPWKFRENVASATAHRILKCPVALGSSSAASRTFESLNGRSTPLPSLMSMRNVLIGPVHSTGDQASTAGSTGPSWSASAGPSRRSAGRRPA